MPVSTTRTASRPPMTPMLGTRSTPWFGITSRSGAISWAPATRTAGSVSSLMPRFHRPGGWPVQDRFGGADTRRISSPVMELRTLRYFVAVAEELHFGRAAARLHMSQPPLSRAIKQLEADVGAVLMVRSAAGVALTPAGAALLDEARALLGQADRARVRVAAAAGAATLTVGILGDSAAPDATRLADAYRRQHPGVEVLVRDTDLTDPTCGLRAGLVDVALTRGPFDETGLTLHRLRENP